MAEKELKIYERDLYRPVKAFFEEQGYEVKAEVDGCDVVAVKDDEIVITELKVRLNLDVILQAAQRQRIGHRVFVAVPNTRECGSKRFKNICLLLRRLELGLLIVKTRKNPGVLVELDSVPFDRALSFSKSSSRRSKLKKEFSERHGDSNVGGINKEKIVTAYREKVLTVAGLLREHGPLSARALREMGSDDNTYSFLYQNYYGWFTKESKGIYNLNEKGYKEIAQYDELVSRLLEEKKRNKENIIK